MSLFLKNKKKPAILFFLIFFHLILISIQVPLGYEKNYFEKAIFSIFSPVQHGITFFFQKIGNLWDSYFYLWEVQRQNKQWKEEIFLLRQENMFLKKSLNKLENSENIQEFISTIHNSFLIAQVIGVDARNINRSINIDKGSLDGLEKDMIVLDKKGNLVGRIIEPISLKEARVQLITDNNSGVSVISEKTKARGVLAGDGKGNCFLKYIIATEQVDRGEELLTSGFDRIFPSEIKVGTIVSVKPNVSLFQDIKVKPHFEFSHLDLVVVISGDSGISFFKGK